MQIAGRIRGTARGARRTLAVSVNGRIAATARSFYLRGDTLETFSLLVAEDALRAGPNEIRVFQVDGRGSSTSLTPIGGN